MFEHVPRVFELELAVGNGIHINGVSENYNTYVSPETMFPVIEIILNYYVSFDPKLLLQPEREAKEI